MTIPVSIPVALDATGVVQGANQGISAAHALEAALAGVTVGAVATDAALGRSSFGKRTIFGSSQVSDARNYQQMLSGLAATSAVTGQSQRGLSNDVQSLSRQFPGGTAAMIASVQAVQSLGLSSKNQVPQIRSLTGVMVELNAATGSGNTAQLATDFGQLNRQLASLDPSRVSKFADVVTTLHAEAGGSATAMLSFASSIAPVAQQSGLGESSILGISSAFTKLGDDGGAAATAVNKILSDLNSSVRDGSNAMVTYANATGMTVKQFRALYEANPAAALTKVTQGIANAGPGADYLLQSLGLDSTRTERALLELSQSGGLQAQIQTAVGAYGNGNTQKASQAAFSNVNAQFQRAGTAAGQLGDALGTPLLRPLGAFGMAMNAVLGPLAKVANSRVGQDLLTTAVLGTLGGKAALGLTGPLSTLATAQWGLKSGPVAAMVGGMRIGRSSEADGSDALFAANTWRGRTYNPYISDRLNGVDMTGRMSGFNGGILNSAIGFGMSRGGSSAADDILARTAGQSGVRRLFGTAMTGGSLGLQGYLRLAQQPFLGAMRPTGGAPLEMTDEGGPARALGQGLKDAFSDRSPGAAGAALSDFAKDVGGTSNALKTASSSILQYAGAFTAYGAQTAVSGAKLAGGLGKAGIGAIGSVLGTTGGIAAAVGAAAYGGYKLYSGANAYNQNISSEFSQSDIYGTLNSYRDSLGEAGVATLSFADQIKQASVNVAKTVTSQAAARTITPSDIQAFGIPNQKAVVQQYRGTNAQVTAQIGSSYLKGLNPSDIQAVKQDLYNQGYSNDRINAILGALPGQSGTPGGQITGGQISGLIGTVTANSGSAAEGSWWGRNLGLNTLKRSIMTETNGSTQWQELGRAGFGHPDLDAASTSALKDLTGGIGQGYQNNQMAGRGRNYSTQQALRQANQVMQAALATHDADTAVATFQALTASLTGKSITGVSAAQIAGSGGLLGELSSHQSKVYNQTVGQLTGEGFTLSGRGIAAGRGTNNYVTALPGQQGNLFASLFSGRTGGAAGIVGNALSQPESTSAQTSAVSAMIASLTGAGTSLQKIATSADRALGSTSGAQNALMVALLQQTQMGQATAQIGMTGSGAMAAQAQNAIAMASINGNDPTQIAQRQQGQQGAQSALQQLTSYYQQRIMAQYQYQIQSERAQQDYTLQTQRADQDYQRQELRAQQDFNLSKLRNQEDYNLALKRSIQDASIQDYNPYNRITSQPVYGASDLETNLKLQNTAISTQTQNLMKARADGLSAAAIRTLGLSQTSNAQQLQELIDDFAQDPSVIQQINKTIAARGGDAAALYKDPGNTTYERQLQDFNIAQARAKQDYDIQQSRNEQDFQTQMSRNAQDFQIQMSRNAQDLHTSDLEITGNMKQLQADVIKILHGQTVDWSKSLTNTLQDTLTKMRGMAPKLRAAADGAISSAGGGGSVASGEGPLSIHGGISGGGTHVGSSPVRGVSVTTNPNGTPRVTRGVTSYVTPGTGATTTSNLTQGEEPDGSYQRAHPVNVAFNKGIAKSMLKQSRWADPDKQFAALDWVWGGHESGWSQYAHNPTDPDPATGEGAYGIPQARPGEKMKSDGSDWRTNPATQIKWGLEYIAGKYGSPVNLLPVNMGGKGYYSVGHGYATGGIALGPQMAYVAEAGSPEAMIPLNKQGVQMLANALSLYLGADDAAMITTGGRQASISVTNHYVYDQRQQFTGPVSVEASDPKEMGNKLAAKRRLTNATAPKGVSTSVGSGR